jgi:YbbR domain-containing protein
MKEAQFVNSRPNRLLLKHILRKLFLEDWVLKLSALVITFALWFGVSYSNKKGEARMQANVLFRPADNATLTDATRNTLDRQEWTVKVSGDERSITDLYNTQAKIPVTVDLTTQEPGDLVVQLTPDTVSANLPKGVKLDDIQPSRIAISIEPLEEKELPVRAEITGQPAPGLEIYNTTVTPARVGLSGPKSYVDTLDSVPTETRDITGAKQDMTFRQVPASLPNKRTTVFNAGVDVVVRIGEKRVEKTFALTTVSGKRITAVLYGPNSLLTKTKPGDLKAEVIKSGSGEDEPRLTLPDALQGTVEIRTAKIR